MAEQPPTTVLSGPYEQVRRTFECIRRFQKARVAFDLRSRGARKVWEQVAYEPRVDYGEDVPLRPNCHIEGETGWIE